MEYDVLIGKLYNACHEFEKHMTQGSEKDEEFLQKLYALNFEVRKNGIKGLGDPEDFVMEDDVRIHFNDLISSLVELSDESHVPSVSLKLDEIREDLLSDGIDGLKPY